MKMIDDIGKQRLDPSVVVIVGDVRMKPADHLALDPVVAGAASRRGNFGRVDNYERRRGNLTATLQPAAIETLKEHALVD